MKLKFTLFTPIFTPSFGSGAFSGEASGTVISTGEAAVFGPEGATFFSDVLLQSVISSETESTVFSSGSSDFTSEADGSSVSEMPWYEYEPFKEISSKTFFTPEELLEKFIAWIKNQGVRQAQSKIGTKRPVPMVTPKVEDVRVRSVDVEKFENKVKMLYAKPVRGD